MHVLHRRGHGWGHAAVSVLLDPLLMVVAALLLLPLGRGGSVGGLALLGPLAVLGLLPGWRDPLVRRLRRRVKLPVAGNGAAAKGPSPRQLLPGSFPGSGDGFLLVRCPGFVLCGAAFLPSGVAPGSLRAAFALAWTAGPRIPSAPAGLGVFELVLVLWLGGIVQEEAALLATALSALAAAGSWG